MDNYYVDATLGNDAGTSAIGDPWETWDKARGETYSAGDTINFKRGEMWTIGINERWDFTDDGNSGAYITIDAYGGGAKPILDCEIEVVGRVWNNEGGDVWSTAWTATIHRCRLDGQDSGTTGANGDIDGTTYLWAYEGGVTDKLFVYAEADPDGFYTSIKIANTGNYAFRLNGCNYVKFQNLRIHGGDYSFYAVLNVNNTYIEINDCDLWYGFYAIRCEPTAGGGGTCNNFTVDGNDIHSKLNYIDTSIDSSEAATYNAIAIANECDDWLVTGNTFTGWQHGQYGITAIVGVPTQGCNNNIVEHNTFDGTGAVSVRAFGVGGNAGKCTGNIYRYNVIKNTSIRCQLGGENNEVYYNLFYHTVEAAATNHANDSEGLSFVVLGICDSNKLYNNIFYDIYNNGLEIGVDCTNGIIKNNIVMNVGQGGDEPNICMWHRTTGVSGFTIENNCFYDPDTANVIKYGLDPDRTVAYANANYDGYSNNISVNPLFKDAPNGDFHLLIDSPCINAGIDVGLTEDFDGNPVRYYPDIGAFERGYNVEVDYLKKVYLGLPGSEIKLPELMWLKGSPPTWSVSSNKEIEVAKMMDKSRRINFFGVKREWSVGFGYLSKSQLDVLRGLNALNQILHFQNNNEDTTWYDVYISSFSHEPERMDIRQLERYKIEMTLKEV